MEAHKQLSIKDFLDILQASPWQISNIIFSIM